MRSVNPLVIPRNHKVEESLEAANRDDFEPVKNLLKILEKPFDKQNDIHQYQLIYCILIKLFLVQHR